MFIMYLNPLGIPDYNQTFADMALEYKDPENAVWVASLNASVGLMDNLEYRTYEALITADTLKAVRDARVQQFDALVIGCFYDPVLEDAREIATSLPATVGGPMVVVAPCQSSCECAMRIGNRFSVIIGQWKWMDQMEAVIRGYGYGRHLASFRSIDMSVPEMVADHEETEARIKEQAMRAVMDDKAEVIVLGCTLEIGFYQTVQDYVGVPVIDPSIAALKTAEAAAWLRKKSGWGTSNKWGMAPPSEADIGRFRLFPTPYEFGEIIQVPVGLKSKIKPLPPQKGQLRVL